jgi:glycosyltransferase involved in cell wall biosynthesis
VTPDISLLVPCYNAAAYLPSLIELARAQTNPFHEIICYDDGSTDHTAEVAKELGVGLIVGPKNQGPAFARNRLLEATSASWVHFHDADDRFDTQFVEKMAKALPGPASGAICNVRIVTANGSSPDQCLNFEAVATAPDLVRYFLEEFVLVEATVYPTAQLRAIKGFCEKLKFCEDRDLQVRIAKSRIRFVHVNEPLVTWIRREKTHVTSFSAEYQLRHARWFLHRCYRYLPKDYHWILGERALYYARQFYARGAIRDARLCIYFARLCGVHSPVEVSAKRKLIARLFGSECLFRLEDNWERIRKAVFGRFASQSWAGKD